MDDLDRKLCCQLFHGHIYLSESSLAIINLFLAHSNMASFQEITKSHFIIESSEGNL